MYARVDGSDLLGAESVKRVLLLVLVTVGSGWALVSLLFLGSMFYDPPYSPTDLVNGYFYSDPGGPKTLAKWISSTNAEDRGVVVASTVDEYKVVGSRILVARRNIRPNAHPKGGWGQQFPTCQYWVIDTIAHTTIRSKKTEEWGALTCYGVVRHE